MVTACCNASTKFHLSNKVPASPISEQISIRPACHFNFVSFRLGFFRGLSTTTSMRLATHELVNIDELVHNPKGFMILVTSLSISLVLDFSLLILMWMKSILFHPFMGAAILVNIGVIILSGVSIFKRKLFYAPLIMSVTTIVCMIYTLMTFYIYANDIMFILSLANALSMLVIWTAFATTVKSRPALYLHPFKMSKPEADIEMTPIKKTVNTTAAVS